MGGGGRGYSLSLSLCVCVCCLAALGLPADLGLGMSAVLDIRDSFLHPVTWGCQGCTTHHFRPFWGTVQHYPPSGGRGTARLDSFIQSLGCPSSTGGTQPLRLAGCLSQCETPAIRSLAGCDPPCSTATPCLVRRILPRGLCAEHLGRVSGSAILRSKGLAGKSRVVGVVYRRSKQRRRVASANTTR
jgi:hypothetical protein